MNAADGISVLSFKDAVRLALSDDRATQPSSRHYTVDDALDDYFESRRACSPPASLDRDRVAANAWIVPLPDDKQSSGPAAEPRLSRLRASLHGRRIASLTANDLRS